MLPLWLRFWDQYSLLLKHEILKLVTYIAEVNTSMNFKTNSTHTCQEGLGLNTYFSNKANVSVSADRKSTLMLKVVRQPLFPASAPEAFQQVTVQILIALDCPTIDHSWLSNHCSLISFDHWSLMAWIVVAIGLFLVFFMPFSYNGVC